MRNPLVVGISPCAQRLLKNAATGFPAFCAPVFSCFNCLSRSPGVRLAKNVSKSAAFSVQMADKRADVGSAYPANAQEVLGKSVSPVAINCGLGCGCGT